MVLEQIAKEINSAQKIYVASHINPDGDNVGALMGTYIILKDSGKDVTAVRIDEVPDNIKFLPRLSETVSDEGLEAPDLFISVDCADLERLGGLKDLYLSAKRRINIDHHSTNTNFGDINWVDSDSPATCEMVFHLFNNLGYEISKDAATCIYTGISTDTGSFKYDSVKKSTFEAAGVLIDKDIDINQIAVNLYQSRSKAKTDLLIKTLNSLKYYHDSKLAIVHVNDELIKQCGAHKSDSDGIVEFVRDIDGVEVAILLKEKSDSIKLSVRTKEYVSAINIVSSFGGGGHIRAAGATLELPLDKRIEDIVKIVEGELNGWRSDN
ncbi:phosphoesterase RecJ domain-containing protein [Peptoniphilus asaccharolyticus DSM 20463]|uniref:Phosphoesterase RecJ domain-containing protein n=1 Tax=Peptoniphilus asaccharolyticus DSM 20463 TaxID=573058 RepID=A0A1W1USN0_PEPAS|nr:bifunctional oligoribonuclease/PAP phosphatase NrnA [Peptoniphilus asaccharolyticus]MBL7575103.1 bifunctional oligoribonuclease/PAP phosphatase NrnA [Peptoniphilus asaccharolyticus]SMB83734.1 phosphoesterase RecJ domain-containing protein [Peptoniphilus asaccharolyticus DSM 20463]